MSINQDEILPTWRFLASKQLMCGRCPATKGRDDGGLVGQILGISVWRSIRQRSRPTTVWRAVCISAVAIWFGRHSDSSKPRGAQHRDND